jgi:hypothetical protein
MPIVSILFYLVICDNLSLIDESRFWAQDISSRCHASILIHGGHWPPTSFVEEFPIWIYFFISSLWERAHVWSYLDLFACLQT